MFEAYSVAVSLKLNNLVSPQLKLLSEEFAKLEGLSVSLSNALKNIGTDSAALRSLASGANASNRALERASASAARLERSLGAIRGMNAASALPSVIPIAAPRASGGGGAGGGGRAGGFHGGNIHMGPHGVGIGTVGMAAGDWFLPLAVSGAAIYGGKALYESAKDLDTEKQRFKLFGLNSAQNNEAFEFATGMRVYGMTQTENLRNFREAQGVFRESGLEGSSALAGAKLAAPMLSKLNALDAALDESSAANSHASNLSMLKWVESAGGLKSQEEFNRLANMGYRLKVGSGDTVDWRQLQQFQKRAASFGINISGEGMARIEPAISTLGGSSTGVALRTGGNRLEGIIKGLPTPVIDELLQYGVWDRSKVMLNSKGGVAKFLDPNGPMSAANSKLLIENPELFYEQVIRPIYAKMGLDAAGVIRQNAMIYGSVAGGLANEWEKSLAVINQAALAYNKTKNIADATAQLPQSLSGQEKEFVAAWTDFKTEWGTRVLPIYNGILKFGAKALRAAANPGEIPEKIEKNVGWFGEINRIAWNELKKEAGYLVGSAASYAPGGGFARHPADNPTHVTLQFAGSGEQFYLGLTKFQAKKMNAPPAGINLFDGRQALPPPSVSP